MYTTAGCGYCIDIEGKKKKNGVGGFVDGLARAGPEGHAQKSLRSMHRQWFSFRHPIFGIIWWCCFGLLSSVWVIFFGFSGRPASGAGLLNKMIRESRTGDEYMLLILDKFTVQVFNSCMKLSDVVDAGVSGTGPHRLFRPL